MSEVKAYGVSRSFAYNEMKAGRLKYFNIGVMRLISCEATEQWRQKYEYGDHADEKDKCFSL